MKYKFNNPHMDAAENAFFSRQLEHIRAGAFEVQYPEFKARQLIPVNSAVASGAEVFTYRYFNHFGGAKEIKSYSDDLPRSDVEGEEASSLIRGLGSSYGFSVQEIRAASQAGTDLRGHKAMACRRSIEQELDKVAMEGGMGLQGLLSLTGVDIGASAGLFSALTPDQVVAELHGIAHAIVDGSNGVELPDTLILPLSSYNFCASTRMTDGSDVTILRHFMNTSPYINSVEWSHKCETAGAGGVKRMICYKRSPEKLELIMPLEFTQHVPEIRGLETIVACEARTGGVVLYYPKSMRYVDGI